ncbi:metallophosphoesterase family protein [Guptibacillus algicola]|uniref:metallophosphoesterase family protein n=1 Tax=Guptibacillus algicola TaxID=225844 RepID=UPI001CD75616|nr:metallophosphoesterase family protein [Alkalihalobacillus algicola]MCA0988245.1 YfcE family phosphodiesterase [Alkalihalobacillus algicola]
MNIIIISDTHMPRKGKSLPLSLVKELEQSDLIIHAGDWQTLDVYEELKQYAPISGVYGNVDDNDIRERFEFKEIIECSSLKIGITHGHGRNKTTEKRAVDLFEDDDVDVIIFGHSHIPVHKEYDGRIIFNPGSPTDKRRQPMFSFGKLTFTEGKPFKLEHVYFDDRKDQET